MKQYNDDDLSSGLIDCNAALTENGSLGGNGLVVTPPAINAAWAAWNQLEPQDLLAQIDEEIARAPATAAGATEKLHWLRLRGYDNARFGLYAESTKDFEKYLAVLDKMALDGFHYFREPHSAYFHNLSDFEKNHIRECKKAHIHQILSAIVKNLTHEGNFSAAAALCDKFIEPGNAGKTCLSAPPTSLKAYIGKTQTAARARAINIKKRETELEGGALLSAGRGVKLKQVEIT